MKFYILCKNEGPNIRKCIEALLDCGMEVVVLDSGSTDDTLNIASQYPVEIRPYRYTNHCHAYNEITSTEAAPHCGILDADMELTPALSLEIERLATAAEVLVAPIQMYVDGQPLRRGSLCPPKAIVFHTGKAYFESVGHGERLVTDVRTTYTQSALIHNDLKPYTAYLSTQARYAENFVQRADKGHLTWRDRLRLRAPIFLFLTPLYSLLVKGGIFSKRGWLYALDRLIAEGVMYRQAIAHQVKKKQ